MTVSIWLCLFGMASGCILNGLLVAIPGILSGTIAMAVIRWAASKYYQQEAIGSGDVWWMGCVGAFTGWLGALIAIPAGSIIGSIYALVLVAFKGFHRRMHIPFIPMLSAGALCYTGGWIDALLQKL